MSKQKHNTSLKLDWPRRAVLELIAEWAAHECIYNMKHPLYNNKHARFDALNKIAERLQDSMPGVEADAVKLKLNYLRGQYSREIAKNTESSGDMKYEPSTYWFAKMKFLRPHINSRKVNAKFEVFSNDSHGAFENNNSTQFEADLMSSEEETLLSPHHMQPAKKIKHEEEKPKKTQAYQMEDEVLERASEALEAIAASEAITAADGSTNNVNAFVNYLKYEVMKITDEELQDELQHEIENLLYKFKKKQRQLNILKNN